MNKWYISIRWKFVSTYLLLVLISLMLINILISASLTNYLIEEKKNNLLDQGTIVADQLAPSIASIQRSTNLGYVENTIKSLSLRLGARTLVIDRFGKVISDSFDDYSGENIGGVQEVKSALGGFASARAYRFSDVGETIYACVPIYNGGSIVGALLMASSPQNVYDQIHRILGDFYKLSAAAIVVTIMISFIFSNLLSRPIVTLTEVVKDVSLKNENQKAKVLSHDELGELAESVNQMITKLYHVDDLRKKFVSNVSHELRTPITSMKIIAETMLDSKPQDIAIYEDFMCDINGELDRLNRIIDTLLNLTNLENASLELECATIDFNQLVHSTVQTLLPIAKKEAIQLNYLDEPDTLLYCDSLKVRQCLINIINNAIKYTPSGGKVEVSLKRSRDYITAKVSDTGIGIPESDIPHIFDRFYRVDSARSRETGGTGLGLAIAEQIANLHGGKIKVSSQIDQGTIFYILLPRKLE